MEKQQLRARQMVSLVVVAWGLMILTVAALDATGGGNDVKQMHYAEFIDDVIPAGGEGCYFCVFGRKPQTPQKVAEWEGSDVDNPYLLAAINEANKNPQLSRMVVTSKWDATRMCYAAFPTKAQVSYQREVEKLMTPRAHEILALKVSSLPTTEMIHDMPFGQ